MGKRFDPSENMLSGYHPLDGTIEFYGRIQSVLKPTDCVVDVGAGRGMWFHKETSQFRRTLHDIKPMVASFIGVDVDRAVLENPTTTENHLIVDGKIPLPDHCADVVIADYVLEHVVDPEGFTAEIDRILKPGGYFAARTPGKYEYVSIAARLIKNRYHAKVLKSAQPDGRENLDVFPTAYKMNTLSQIQRLFPEYRNFSYLYGSEPGYYFGRKWVYSLMCAAHRLLPRALVHNIFVFVKKPG